MLKRDVEEQETLLKGYQAENEAAMRRIKVGPACASAAPPHLRTSPNAQGGMPAGRMSKGSPAALPLLQAHQLTC